MQPTMSPQSNSEYSTFEKLHLNILSFGKAINTQSLHFLTSSQHKCKHGIKFTERQNLQFSKIHKKSYLNGFHCRKVRWIQRVKSILQKQISLHQEQKQHCVMNTRNTKLNENITALSYELDARVQRFLYCYNTSAAIAAT